MLMVIRFRVRENLRYLSHAETMRVFQRACVRAQVQAAYSRGFNPHLRMSLVLPRSVGVESDDEMLCLWLEEGNVEPDAELLKDRLAGELPEGIEVISAEISRSKNVPAPSSVRYLLRLRDDTPAKQRIEELLARDEIVVERRTGESSNARKVDVRPFIKSISADSTGILVDCAVSPAGTIRVDEILGLLQIETDSLAEPVRRTSVQYTD